MKELQDQLIASMKQIKHVKDENASDRKDLEQKLKETQDEFDKQSKFHILMCLFLLNDDLNHKR